MDRSSDREEARKGERESAGIGRHRYFLSELTLSWRDVITLSCNIVIILLHVTKGSASYRKKIWGHDSSPWMYGYVIPIVAPHFRVSRTCVTYPLPRAAHKPVLLELILLGFIGFRVINAVVNYATFFKRTLGSLYSYILESIRIRDYVSKYNSRSNFNACSKIQIYT